MRKKYRNLTQFSSVGRHGRLSANTADLAQPGVSSVRSARYPASSEGLSHALVSTSDLLANKEVL